MKGLEWLARVGRSPLDPWRYAMGWSEVAARHHARRLEREGRIERAGERVGLYLSDKYIRIELLDTIKAQTVAAFETARAAAERTAA